MKSGLREAYHQKASSAPKQNQFYFLFLHPAYCENPLYHMKTPLCVLQAGLLAEGGDAGRGSGNLAPRKAAGRISNSGKAAGITTFDDRLHEVPSVLHHPTSISSSAALASLLEMGLLHYLISFSSCAILDFLLEMGKIFQNFRDPIQSGSPLLIHLLGLFFSCKYYRASV